MILDLTKTAIELQPSLSSLRESNIVASPNKKDLARIANTYVWYVTGYCTTALCFTKIKVSDSSSLF